MTLLDILQPADPPEPKGARVVRLAGMETQPVTSPEMRRKARERWARYKDYRNAVRRASGWKI